MPGHPDLRMLRDYRRDVVADVVARGQQNRHHDCRTREAVEAFAQAWLQDVEKAQVDGEAGTFSADQVDQPARRGQPGS